MQFSQPPGYINYGQLYAFNTPVPTQFNGYPEIIGEGNVTSMLSPDGSTQLIFLPTTQWWRPYPNTNVGNVNNPFWNNPGAWFVRSVYGSLQPTLLSEPYQHPYGIQYPRGSNSDCCLNLPAPGFQLKFHNDNCTSTSDISYFFPKQHNWFQKPQGCAAVQVDVPMPTTTVYHQEVVCTKPCYCTPKEPTSTTSKPATEQKIHCMCVKNSNTSNSEMSCEESKLEINTHKRGESRKVKRSKSKKILHERCQCKEQKSIDKTVTTYADQASGFVEEKGRETQTAFNSIPIRLVKSNEFNSRNVNAEVWKPKTHFSKKAMKLKSSGTFNGVCESGCCSGICSCNTDTETEQ